mgnify:FL=1|tara:strand:+ start:130 stop:1080 length:951 start_codon:yes stop_codon:yes gene_type:complete
MFRWEKKGIIFSPSKNSNWMDSYAQCPYTVLHKKFIRIYFSTREKKDSSNQFRSYSGYIDVDRHDPKKILKVCEEPILELGKLGEFDEFGSMAGSVVFHNNEYYLYYCGWQRLLSTPYNWAIGLAKSKNGKKFKKLSKGPILGPTFNEPFLQACPIVYKLSDTKWHMYYLSGIKWIKSKNEKKESQYLLMHATSNDGIYWKRNGVPILEESVQFECQTSCSIIKFKGLYHMFFSYRHGLEFRENNMKAYRIGYAQSDDMINWKRDDKKSGLDVSIDGWDSEMVAYPHVVNVDGKILMFYCGNYFGKNGFGYAELKI